ncbi:hypothetical protein MMC09_006737 [Bachmanniomyces sp. S44760]|nr:hypothetical protein [Bachmanniomyces sp. S44760]
MAESQKTLLITGATGKQGGAVIDALLGSQTTPPFHIVGVTRSTKSKGAQALASRPNCSVVEGKLEDSESIFKQVAGQVWGVYSVTVPQSEKEGEVKLAKKLIDASVNNGVKHFVFSSVDRGGPEKSDADDTFVPHFATKAHIEQYLKQAAALSPQGMTWTILRPVAFLENFTPNFLGKAFSSFWQSMGNQPLQLVATRDIGKFGALAFMNPEKYRNQSLSLAGDNLTHKEAEKIFQDEIGYTMPRTFGFISSALQWANPADIGVMFKWFNQVGYGASIQDCKRQNPEMMDFKTWLHEQSGFEKK